MNFYKDKNRLPKCLLFRPFFNELLIIKLKNNWDYIIFHWVGRFLFIFLSVIFSVKKFCKRILIIYLTTVLYPVLFFFTFFFVVARNTNRKRKKFHWIKKNHFHLILSEFRSSSTEFSSFVECPFTWNLRFLFQKYCIYIKLITMIVFNF